MNTNKTLADLAADLNVTIADLTAIITGDQVTSAEDYFEGDTHILTAQGVEDLTNAVNDLA